MKTNYSFENVTISFTARMNKGLLVDPPLILFLTWTRDCSSAEGVLCKAKNGARKTRNCEKSGFCHRQKWPTKGSIAKHDDSMHMQLPGTIKFQSNPKKEGEVTGGTVSKSK